MHKHKTDFASVFRYLTAGVNCFADWRWRGQMMGTLQKCLLGVVDDAGCKPYGCGKNADCIRVENSYPAWLPQPLFDRGPIARGFFLCPDSEKRPARERVFVFQCPPTVVPEPGGTGGWPGGRGDAGAGFSALRTFLVGPTSLAAVGRCVVRRHGRPPGTGVARHLSLALAG